LFVKKTSLKIVKQVFRKNKVLNFVNCKKSCKFWIVKTCLYVEKNTSFTVFKNANCKKF